MKKDKKQTINGGEGGATKWQQSTCAKLKGNKIY